MIFQYQLIERLQHYGDHVAIENGDQSISYASLLAHANKITAFLLQKNIGKEAIIGIQLSDRANIIGSIIGAMNGRGIIVPIDEALPDNRLRELIEDLEMQYVITSRQDDRISPLNFEKPPTCLYYEDIQAEVEARPWTKDDYPVFTEEDSLYLYFTSGSTGKPKGVVGKNKSLANFIDWEISTFSIDETFRCSQFVSPYFDAFLRDIFVPLMAGGTICIPPVEKAFFESEKMIAWIDQQKINLIHCVPSVFRLFNRPHLTASHFSALKYVLLSGEKINPTELKNWYERFDDRIQLVNLYGTTEATMISSFYRIQPADANKPKIAIGHPIHNTELWVVDQHLKPCQNLIVGELLIVSDYTTKGYFKAPELTAEKFVKVNVGTSTETMAYKTGDRARRSFDGSIELLGREDRQVKLRGMRVDLEQIEHWLFQHEWVKNAVVIKREEEKASGIHEESLIAFVVGEEQLPSNFNLVESIEKYLTGYLSANVMPSNILVMPQFPLLSNGKINYKELLASLNKATKSIIAPANETETKLLGIWQEILGKENISTDDKFNRVGGNSLSIMRLISRIYKEFKVRIALSAIFKNLTIQLQADYVIKANQDNLLTITKAAEKPHYQLSSTQERIFFNYKLDPNSTAYNIPMAWEIKGGIDQEKVEAILNTILQRHETLRTEFRLVEGKVFQFVREEVNFKLESLTQPELKAKEAIQAFIQPFDLTQAPLIRGAVVEVKEHKKLLLIDIHHIVCDGISQVNLYTEFLQLFGGQELRPIAIQYKDYAEWEHHLRTTEIYSNYREFWLKSFDGAIPQLNLPVIDGKAQDASTAGGSVDFNIPKSFLNAITDPLKEKEVSTFSSLFALFFTYMAQLSGQEDLIIGTNSSGRMQYELEGLIGMFAKTLPIRQQIEADQPFSTFAGQIHNYMVQANSKQIFDLIDIVAELNQNNPTPVENLIDVMFVFQNYQNEHQQSGEIEFSRIDLEGLAAKYPITFYAIEEEDYFMFRMEYLSSYFTPADADLLCQQFVTLVKTTAQNPDALISEIIGNDSPSFQIAEEEIDFNF